jgi:hypothetical protein
MAYKTPVYIGLIQTFLKSKAHNGTETDVLTSSGTSLRITDIDIAEDFVPVPIDYYGSGGWTRYFLDNKRDPQDNKSYHGGVIKFSFVNVNELKQPLYYMTGASIYSLLIRPDIYDFTELISPEIFMSCRCIDASTKSTKVAQDLFLIEGVVAYRYAWKQHYTETP